MTHLIPIGKRVVVRPDAAETTTATGLVIPESSVKPSNRGTVVGSNVKSVSIGDEILFSKYGGTEITLGEENLVVLHLGEILGVVSK